MQMDTCFAFTNCHKTIDVVFRTLSHTCTAHICEIKITCCKAIRSSGNGDLLIISFSSSLQMIRRNNAM